MDILELPIAGIEIFPTVKIKLIENGKMPERKTEEASGYDCYVRLPVRIQPLSVARIPLGFALEVPNHIDAEIRPRSSLSGKLMFAAHGTIDSDYRGEVMAEIFNICQDAVEIEEGERLVQLIFREKQKISFLQVSELNPTKRGENGFGSTGVK